MLEDTADRMLPAYTLGCLGALCAKLSIANHIVTHPPTLSAADTQSVLPKGCLVQKTVTDRVAGKLVTWTGVGDFHISHELYKMANQTLEVPMTSEHTLNPEDIDALQFYGMLPGMVSPFLIPDTLALKQLAALFLLDWSNYDATLSVAISLSLHISMVLPLGSLDQILRHYAALTYPTIPLHTLQPVVPQIP